MPGPIRRIAERFMKNPQIVKVKTKEMTVQNIEQFYLRSARREKFDVLTRLLDIQYQNLRLFLVVQNAVLTNYHKH